MTASRVAIRTYARDGLSAAYRPSVAPPSRDADSPNPGPIAKTTYGGSNHIPEPQSGWLIRRVSAELEHLSGGNANVLLGPSSDAPGGACRPRWPLSASSAARPTDRLCGTNETGSFRPRQALVRAAMLDHLIRRTFAQVVVIAVTRHALLKAQAQRGGILPRAQRTLTDVLTQLHDMPGGLLGFPSHIPDALKEEPQPTFLCLPPVGWP